MKPKISVLMPAYNCGNYVAESVKSILNQSLEDFELIIVDGGSTDNTLNVIRSYKDERIVIIEHIERTPLVESLNEGICAANGSLIARQDADDISHPDRLALQYAAFAVDKNLSVLGTAYFCIDEEGELIEKAFPKERVEFVDFRRDNPLCHGSVMFRKAVVLKEGLYDPLFRTVEDYELWCRLSYRNYKIANLSQFLYSLRFHRARVSERNYQESLLHHCLVEEVYFRGLNKMRIKRAGADLRYLYSLLSPKTRKEYHKHMIVNYMKSKKYPQELREFLRLTKLDHRESGELLCKIMLERAHYPRADLQIEKLEQK